MKRAIILFLIALGIAACRSEKPLDLEPESETFYNFARYLFTKDEADIFKNLKTRAARERFIENFWAIRDPDPETEENEFRKEIERRYEFAVKYLRESYLPGWKSDRGMIYIVLGPPLHIDSELSLSHPRIRGYIHWYYGEDVYSALFLRFVDTRGDSVYHLDAQYSSLELLDALEEAKTQVLNKGDGNIERVAFDFALEYDSKKQLFVAAINPKHVTFEKRGDKVYAHFLLQLVIYGAGSDFTRHVAEKSLEFFQDEITAKGVKIRAAFPFALPVGKYKVDTRLTDMLGERFKRKFFTIKVKD